MVSRLQNINGSQFQVIYFIAQRASIDINVFVLAVFFRFCDGNKSNCVHNGCQYAKHIEKKYTKLWTLCPPPFHVQFTYSTSVVYTLFFSLTLTLLLSKKLCAHYISCEMKDFTLVGCFDWFECYFVGNSPKFESKEIFLVQFHALIVLYHLLIILRVSARFFQSFIFGSHLCLSCRLQCVCVYGREFLFKWEFCVNACRILMWC